MKPTKQIDKPMIPNETAHKIPRASHHRAARRRWPEAEWIAGQGRFAVVSRCPTVVYDDALTVELNDTLKDAIESRWHIDKKGCGSGCLGAIGHEIVKLAAKTATGRTRRAA